MLDRKDESRNQVPPSPPATAERAISSTSTSDNHLTESRRRIVRSTGKSSRVRTSQAAGSNGSPPLQAAAAGATIQASVGQRLTIPCSNLTLASNEQMLAGRSSQAGNRQHQRPMADSLVVGGGQRQRPINLANGQGISLIVWHKDDQLDSPIFSIDARGASSLKEAKQQTGSENLKGRAHLEESTRVDSRGFGSTPALVIDEAGPQDGGVYTCTVEFHKAPTQMHQIRVLLISKYR